MVTLVGIEKDSEAPYTAIHTKYLSSWQTDQNTANYLVFLTKYIQLLLKFHIFQNVDRLIVHFSAILFALFYATE